MIIKPKVAEAMNAQIKSEFGASAQYVAIAVYFDEETLPDLAAFFYAQAEEERMHAMKFVHFILEAGVNRSFPGCRRCATTLKAPVMRCSSPWIRRLK